MIPSRIELFLFLVLIGKIGEIEILELLLLLVVEFIKQITLRSRSAGHSSHTITSCCLEVVFNILFIGRTLGFVLGFRFLTMYRHDLRFVHIVTDRFHAFEGFRKTFEFQQITHILLEIDHVQLTHLIHDTHTVSSVQYEYTERDMIRVMTRRHNNTVTIDKKTCRQRITECFTYL